MYDLFDSISNAFTANFVLTLLGAIIAVAGGIVLHMFVFGPKAKDPNASKLFKIANGQHFLPVSFIKVAYYAGAIYLVFLGISILPIMGGRGIPAFIGIAIFGNVILRIAYELVMAVRKAAGLDTENNSADEPKENKPLIVMQPKPQPQYQQFQQPQYQQPGQPMYQQPPQTQYQQPAQPQYQQPAPAPVPQAAPQYQQPAAPVQPVPTPVQPAPAPVQSVPTPVQPVPQPVAAAPVQNEIPQPVPAPVQSIPTPAEPAAQTIPTPVQPAPSAETICAACGKPMKPGAKFCPFCGKPV